MSRMEKFGSRRSRRRMKSTASVVESEAYPSRETDELYEAEATSPVSDKLGIGEKESPLPPRSTRAVPRHSDRMTAWFYRLLIALFILLAGGLLMWGKGLYDD